MRAPASLLLFLARRSLLHSRLSLVLLVAAVAAAVGLQIPNTANLVGYTAELIDQAVTHGQGDVRVQPATGRFLEDGEAAARAIRGVAGVRAAVPALVLPGVVSRGGNVLAAQVYGLDPGAEAFPFTLRDGGPLARSTPSHRTLLLGSSLATRLGVTTGDTIDLAVLLPPPDAGDDAEQSQQGGYLREPCRIQGIVGGAFGAFESVFVDRAWLASSLGQPRAASRVFVYAGEHRRDEGVVTQSRLGPRRAEGLARAVESALPGSRALTWAEDSHILKSAIRANETLGTVSHTMVVIAVTIPIWSLLYINVLQRRRDVALLSAIGFSRGEVILAFVLQALAIGLLGVVAGCALGWGVARWFVSHPIFESDSFVVRPVLSASGFYEPALVVLIATVAASLHPAFRASRLEPARVLRGA